MKNAFQFRLEGVLFIFRQLYPVKELLSIATNTQADSLQRHLSESLFENAIKRDTMGFFFQFQLARFCPSKTIVAQMRNQGVIPTPS